MASTYRVYDVTIPADGSSALPLAVTLHTDTGNGIEYDHDQLRARGFDPHGPALVETDDRNVARAIGTEV